MDQSYEIKNGEKARYLHQLDRALSALVTGLKIEKPEDQDLKEFGDTNNWNWNRLPRENKTYEIIADLVERVRQEYRWFDWQINSEKPSQNKGYFSKLELSAISGLPWLFNFVELHRLRKTAKELLKDSQDYASLAKELRKLLMEDYVELEQVAVKSREISEKAMKKNFLEQIQGAELLSWESTSYSKKPEARLILSLGGEQLWNVSFVKYSPAPSMFEIYVVDLWQDVREPLITEANGKTVVSPVLERAFDFGRDNAAWYILKTLDEKFKSIHPVHVSRALIGPFENKYLTNPDNIQPLPITGELLKEDPNTALLRFSRQYCYAPTHKVEGEEFRQVVPKQNWTDEIIVCPSHLSSRVSRSILGTNVRIFEA
ncbi:hypothetical protein HZA97_08225 [Candidatus Woesearchaeota archaeon]|nr:hypothetical protein [Candidatus Woesearchaeota archaeon]